MQNYSDDVLTVLRNQLEERKRVLDARIRELSGQDPFSDPDRTNDNAASDTEANEESNHDRFAALVAELAIERTAIDNALVRVSEGTYGVCSVCKATIAPERLGALPTATMCLSCEQKKHPAAH